MDAFVDIVSFIWKMYSWTCEKRICGHCELHRTDGSVNKDAFELRLKDASLGMVGFL